MKTLTKLILVLIVLFYSNQKLIAQQSAYYDAEYIYQNCFSEDDGTFIKKNDLFEVLKKYYPGVAIDEATLKNNPFFKEFVPQAIALSNDPVNYSNNISKTGLVSAGIDGLTKFLIKRAKQELLISIFSKLQDTKKNPEFAVLFPNTKTIVDNFEAWEYNNIINTLREAFNKDLKNLMGNIPKLNGITEYDDKAKKRVEAIKDFFASQEGIMLNSALVIGNGVTTNQKIPDIVNDVIVTSKLCDAKILDKNQQNILKLINILSYSIRNNAVGKSYISTNDLNSFFGNAVKVKLYFGLIYELVKKDKIVIYNEDISNLLTQAASQAATISKIKTYVLQVVSDADVLVKAYKELADAKKKGEKDLSPYWANNLEGLNTFFQNAFDLQTINQQFVFPRPIENLLGYASSTLEIAVEINDKNYNAAIVSIANLFPKTNEDSVFKTYLVKYGSFAANVVSAKTSDEIETAIESVALPVGSATIKKKSMFNIALNGYLGGFYGREYLAEKVKDNTAKSAGVYAPVGITFSVGFQRAGSLSLLLSIIDVGAVAAYRLNDPDTEKLPEVTLQNIFAPGLGIAYGIPGIPLSAGLSYQLGPALREINATTATTGEINRRWQFFLAVDIPIFNFYTKSK